MKLLLKSVITTVTGLGLSRTASRLIIYKKQEKTQIDNEHDREGGEEAISMLNVITFCYYWGLQPERPDGGLW